jgi:hypothetical protein
MAAKSKETVSDYKQGKVNTTKYEIKAKTEAEKRMIYKYERDAQMLE